VIGSGTVQLGIGGEEAPISITITNNSALVVIAWHYAERSHLARTRLSVTAG
jgi:hypothetical protein